MSAGDIHFYDKLWGEDRIMGMVTGEVKSSDWNPEGDAASWFELKAAAYDRGNVDSVLDCIQFENAVRSISDIKARAAVILRSFGLDPADVGAVLGGRGERRTGAELISDGVVSASRFERDRRG